MLQANIQNFTKKELDCNCCKNLVHNDEALIALQSFRYYLNRRFKRTIRLILTCGTRCPQHNKEIGGAKKSYHLTGQAFDLISPDIDYIQLYSEAVNCKQFSTVIRYDKSKFVHVDTRQRPDYELNEWTWDK